MSTWVTAAAIVACGVGAALRYWLGLARAPHQIAWPTIVANTVGSAVLAGAAAAVHGGASGWVLVVLGAGLAGGLTTFSSLALDAATLWSGGRRSTAAGYLGVTFAAGLAAAAVGWSIGVALI